MDTRLRWAGIHNEEMIGGREKVTTDEAPPAPLIRNSRHSALYKFLWMNEWISKPKQSKFSSLPILTGCQMYCVCPLLLCGRIWLKALTEGPMALALASTVQALALRVEALALRFWPWLHHCRIPTFYQHPKFGGWLDALLSYLTHTRAHTHLQIQREH